MVGNGCFFSYIGRRNMKNFPSSMKLGRIIAREITHFLVQFPCLDSHYDVTNSFQIWCQSLELRKSSEKLHRRVL